MPMKTIKVNLFSDGIDDLVKQLNDYAKNLGDKNRKFVELLAEVGIRVAEGVVQNGNSQMASRVSFEKEIESDGGYTLGMITGIGETFESHWIDKDGEQHDDEVFPLAMLEFGSAARALPPQEAYGGYGGQGTFSYSGNEDKYAWYVTKVDGSGATKKELGFAIEPTRPMYNAMLEMQEQVEACAKKAFGGD